MTERAPEVDLAGHGSARRACATSPDGAADGVAGAATLAVAVLTRERWPALAACLASLHGQAAAASVPIVVLVNGSSDDSAARTRERYPDIEVHETATNLGCPGGRNHLTDLCSADWVAHVDDDGTVGEGFLAVVRREIDRAPEGRAVIAGNVIDVDVNPDATFTSGPTGSFSGGICAIRRADFQRVGGYPDDGLRQGEEVELSMKLHDVGGSIHRSGDLILYHPKTLTRAKRLELLRTALHQALITGVKLCPWWLLPVWTVWKLLVYLRLAIGLRSPSTYVRALGDVGRSLPRARRARRPVRARAVLAASGRFSSPGT